MNVPGSLMTLVDLAGSIVSWIGGAGGLAYWFDLYRRRARLRVHYVQDVLKSSKDLSNPGIVFEIENISPEPNSLARVIEASGYTPTGKQPRIFGFTIQSEDRALKAFEPKRFDAICNKQSEALPFLWYVTYTFRPSRGRPVVVRVRNAEGEQLPWLGFYIGLLGFRLRKRRRV